MIPPVHLHLKEVNIHAVLSLISFFCCAIIKAHLPPIRRNTITAKETPYMYSYMNTHTCTHIQKGFHQQKRTVTQGIQRTSIYEVCIQFKKNHRKTVKTVHPFGCHSTGVGKNRCNGMQGWFSFISRYTRSQMKPNRTINRYFGIVSQNVNTGFYLTNSLLHTLLIQLLWILPPYAIKTITFLII